jgi:hypothetical protein
MARAKNKQARQGGKAGEPAPPSTARMITVIALIVITAGGITAIAITSSEREAAPIDPAAAAATTADPEPWHYDPVTNKHWHEGHGHWHDGPPPPLADRGAGIGDGVEAPPHIPAPTPWQYDDLTDRHYDPGHGHWHAGPPPEGVDENTLVSPFATDRVDPPEGVTNPEPWQYHEPSNKHYHPGHAHWHAGPPPPPDQR